MVLMCTNIQLEYFISWLSQIFSTQIHTLFRGFVKNWDADVSPLIVQNQGVISVKLIDFSKAFA